MTQEGVVKAKSVSFFYLFKKRENQPGKKKKKVHKADLKKKKKNSISKVQIIQDQNQAERWKTKHMAGRLSGRVSGDRPMEGCNGGMGNE